jgi:hypothetical protein
MINLAITIHVPIALTLPSPIGMGEGSNAKPGTNQLRWFDPGN